MRLQARHSRSRRTGGNSSPTARRPRLSETIFGSRPRLKRQGAVRRRSSRVTGQRANDLAARAYVRMRKLFQGRVLSPAAVTSAEELSRRLHVGRTPVREALLRLRDEGFIEVLPQRGVRARAVTEGFARELYEIRCLIEANVVRQPANGLQTRTLPRLPGCRRINASSIARPKFDG